MDTRDYARLDPDNPIGTDFHSRVVAGPGAGKTTWLARQIRHIVRTSMRLGAFGRVLCISYTSVAAEELQKRLQDIANRVYVSTIHSFLYENIVKPYVWLVIDEHGQPLVNYRELAGHTENRPSRNRVSKWINDNGLKYLFYPLKLTEELLGDLTWTLDGETCVLQVRDPDRGNNAFSNRSRSFPNDQPELLLQYKKLCWRQGEIHHEDVLYFAYRIVREHQSVLTFISSRFPHVVVDEFQDTNPIQTYILTQMANSGSFVGVIGDPAQSIYSFQDARMSDFTRFQLPGQRDFVIEGNRRSTTSIVRFLNTLRTDRLRQATIRDDEGNAPICFTGSNITGISHP